MTQFVKKDVGRVIRNRQMLQLAKAKFDVPDADLGRVLPRLLEHLMGHVDANDMARGTDLPGRKKAIKAGAAAEVDDDLARLQIGNGLGIAAA
jgi:hypothetical protein